MIYYLIFFDNLIQIELKDKINLLTNEVTTNEVTTNEEVFSEVETFL